MMASTGSPATRTLVLRKGIHKNGFAFAQDVQSSEQVFISPKIVAMLNVAQKNGLDTVKAVIEMGDKGSFVVYLPDSSQRAWGDWQVGSTQVKLPDTVVGSDHGGLDLLCVKCGTEIVSGIRIFKIHNGALWTNAPASSCGGHLVLGNKWRNEFKKSPLTGDGVIVTDVNCSCGNHVGAEFPEYVDSDVGVSVGPFPRCKLTVMRENKSGLVFNQTVVKSISRDGAEAILEKLTLMDAEETPIGPRKSTLATEYEKRAERKAENEKEVIRRQAEDREAELLQRIKDLELQVRASKTPAQEVPAGVLDIRNRPE